MDRRRYLNIVGGTASALILAGSDGGRRPGSVPDEITFRTEFNVWNPGDNETLDDGVDYEWGFRLSQ